MAFGVKFVPLTPDAHSPLPYDASRSKFLDEQILAMRQHMSPEEYKRELIALRERDMAITKPTQPEYFARSQRPPVQIASPSFDSSFYEYNPDFPFLDISFPDQQYYSVDSFSPDISPSPPVPWLEELDLSTSYFEYSTDYLDQLWTGTEMSKMETFSTLYSNMEEYEMDMGSDRSADLDLDLDLDFDLSSEDVSSMTIDDESLQSLVEEYDNLLGDVVAPLTNTDSDPNMDSESEPSAADDSTESS